ncbi:ABC transporter ATP-binding protein [Neoroseomonas oryzicola]|uniref:ABC transporter ATP-binding protein n=1 Tax=Neoroseomonas oryzicola TaxID=535904 RepID=A0A9X9WCA0_9PROT|nr:ABC transporter ATP-binding protein [Neoroseomonas oryzicola]MBR0657960.1 ABC transporter ATP-binding protein [Neoroseomonas oryzicola]NKE18722.1 ABC transporter ATP-binding protein [Neoroseomonas oryzicola]
MAAAQPLLEVRDLKVHFFTREGVVRAVDGVDYSVNRAETLGIVGESGSGKTVSSLAMLRLVPPPARTVAGQILFDGEDLLTRTPKQMAALRGRHISMIFQNPATSLNPIYSIGAQLTEILTWHEKASRRDAEARAIELLGLVGISDPATRLRQYPHELSGGMRQRIGIARALLCNPSLVLADEPTTALDVTIQAQILELLAELQARFRMSMVLVTHDMGVVARMATRITVMYAGRVCETADAATIFNAPQHPYTRALLESMPRIDHSYAGPARRVLPSIPGRPPNLLNPPSGCRFHDRCPEAQAECRCLLPVETAVAPGHTVSCLRRGSPGIAA